MARNEKTSPFVSALRRDKKLSQHLKQAKEARDESKPSQIPAGKYECRLQKVSTYETKSGDPGCRFSFVVATGDWEGEVLSKKHELCDATFGDTVRTAEEAYQRFSVDLQRLGVVPEDEDEAEEFWSDPTHLDEALNELGEARPLVKVSVTRRKDSDWPTVYIDGLADEQTPADDEDDAPPAKAAPPKRGGGTKPPAEEPDADDNDDNDDSNGDDDDSGDAEEVVIIRKMQVYYTPMGSRKKELCNVVASNAPKRTCDLFNPTTKKNYKGVSWDAVEVITD